MVSGLTRQKTGLPPPKVRTVTLTQTQNILRTENPAPRQTQRCSSVASTRRVTDLGRFGARASWWHSEAENSVALSPEVGLQTWAPSRVGFASGFAGGFLAGLAFRHKC